MAAGVTLVFFATEMPPDCALEPLTAVLAAQSQAISLASLDSAKQCSLSSTLWWLPMTEFSS